MAAKSDFRHCVEHFIYIILCIAHENSLSLYNKLLVLLFFKDREWLANLFKVTWLVNGEVKFRTQAGWPEPLATSLNCLPARTCYSWHSDCIAFSSIAQIVVTTTRILVGLYGLQIKFTHIISFDLNTPVRFAATCRGKECINSKISTSLVLKSLKFCHYGVVTRPLLNMLDSFF